MTITRVTARRARPSWLASTVELQVELLPASVDLEGGDTTPLGTRFGGTFNALRRRPDRGLSVGLRARLGPHSRGRVVAGRPRTLRLRGSRSRGEPSKTTVQPLAGLDLDYAITPALRVGLDYQATRLKAHVTRGTLQMIGVGVQFSF